MLPFLLLGLLAVGGAAAARAAKEPDKKRRDDDDDDNSYRPSRSYDGLLTCTPPYKSKSICGRLSYESSALDAISYTPVFNYKKPELAVHTFKPLELHYTPLELPEPLGYEPFSVKQARERRERADNNINAAWGVHNRSESMRNLLDAYHRGDSVSSTDMERACTINPLADYRPPGLHLPGREPLPMSRY